MILTDLSWNHDPHVTMAWWRRPDETTAGDETLVHNIMDRTVGWEPNLTVMPYPTEFNGGMMVNRVVRNRSLVGLHNQIMQAVDEAGEFEPSVHPWVPHVSHWPELVASSSGIGFVPGRLSWWDSSRPLMGMVTLWIDNEPVYTRRL